MINNLENIQLCCNDKFNKINSVIEESSRKTNLQVFVLKRFLRIEDSLRIRESSFEPSKESSSSLQKLLEWQEKKERPFYQRSDPSSS